jgi:hypothetical protein
MTIPEADILGTGKGDWISEHAIYTEIDMKPG